MLFLIGLGLADHLDITLKGLEAIKTCDKVYLEMYTSILVGSQKNEMEKLYGRTVLEADREFVEGEDIEEKVIKESKEKNIAFLVVGDVYGATTHSDLYLRAKNIGVQVKVIHNASILTGVGLTGLQLYRFGQTVSIVFFTEKWRPDSFYDKIKQNREIGLHTLCLVDIKVKEQSEENLLRGRKIYEPPRYMTNNQCIEQLLEVEEKRKENVYSSDTKCFGVARLGHDSQIIVSGTMKELKCVDFGAPLHSFIIAGTLHEMEEEYYNLFHISKINPPLLSISTTDNQNK